MTKPKPKDQLLPLLSVTVRGKTYATVKDAAKALKVKPNTVYSALHHGRIDMVGMGKGNHKAHRAPYIKPVALKVSGVDFCSMRALSLWLGRSDKYVSNVLRKQPNAMARLEEEVLAKKLAEEAKRTKLAYTQHNKKMNEGITVASYKTV